MDITEANFSARTHMTLKQNGLYDLETIAGMTKERFMELRGMSARSLEEVERALAENGMAFADAQFNAPKGFIMLHDVKGRPAYINVDHITIFMDSTEPPAKSITWLVTDCHLDSLETVEEVAMLIDIARR